MKQRNLVFQSSGFLKRHLRRQNCPFLSVAPCDPWNLQLMFLLDNVEVIGNGRTN
jgi:hypothetical protein